MLSERAAAARAHADTCSDPSCHALAAGLENALDAAAREQLNQLAEEPVLDGIPSPEQAGHPATVRIPQPGHAVRNAGP